MNIHFNKVSKQKMLFSELGFHQMFLLIDINNTVKHLNLRKSVIPCMLVQDKELMFFT